MALTIRPIKMEDYSEFNRLSAQIDAYHREHHPENFVQTDGRSASKYLQKPWCGL